jgi:hypothetical protein
MDNLKLEFDSQEIASLEDMLSALLSITDEGIIDLNSHQHKLIQEILSIISTKYQSKYQIDEEGFGHHSDNNEREQGINF